jgi:hypothetical protein
MKANFGSKYTQLVIFSTSTGFNIDIIYVLYIYKVLFFMFDLVDYAHTTKG